MDYLSSPLGCARWSRPMQPAFGVLSVWWKTSASGSVLFRAILPHSLRKTVTETEPLGLLVWFQLLTEVTDFKSIDNKSTKIIAKINGWGPPCRFDTTSTSMLATWLIAHLQHINLQNLVEVRWAVAASSSAKWLMGWSIVVCLSYVFIRHIIHSWNKMAHACTVVRTKPLA